MPFVSPAGPSRLPRVAIIGGGPGGLFTAWHIEHLARDPLAITIFEASERLGGKLWSPTFSGAQVRYEAGAAELYDYESVGDDPLRELIRMLWLPTVPISGAAVHVAGRRIACLDDIRDTWGRSAVERFIEFDTFARSAVSPCEFFESGSDYANDAAPVERFDAVVRAMQSPAAEHYVESMIHSDLATEPGSTTAEYGLQNYLMNDPAYLRLYRIVGGNELLVAAIADRLSAEVRLNTMATEIHAAPDGTFRVTSRSPDRRTDEAFDIVILALPIEPLKRIIFADGSLGEALRRHVVHHDHPGHYLRISFLLDGPVPAMPGEDDFIMTDALGGACLYVETGRATFSHHGALGWLLAGEAALTMAAWSDEDIVTAAIDALPGSLAGCRDRIIEQRVHRWTAAVSAAPGGWHPLPLAVRHRPSELHPHLFVVGDYLYDSTLNGVFDSAEYVAGWVAALPGHTPQ